MLVIKTTKDTQHWLTTDEFPVVDGRVFMIEASGNELQFILDSFVNLPHTKGSNGNVLGSSVNMKTPQVWVGETAWYIVANLNLIVD